MPHLVIVTRWGHTPTMNKLTQQQYFELQEQFDRTPDLYDGYSASGEHYILIALLNRFGFYPRGREQAIEISEELLAHGWRA